MRSPLLAAAAAALVPAAAPAQQPDTTIRVTFDAFVDAYYAFDLNEPATLDRQYTTQPARHNEFNVNLAHVGATLAADGVRARLALQAGTSVQSNYAAEPAVGAVSGPDVARFLQEAYAGVRVGERLWIDGGIFFSNMGMEGWVSSGNPTYTRSLVADFSPYYSAGVRAVWQATPTLAARVDVMNGWQNVSESNTAKSVGTRLDWTPADGRTLSHWTYVGSEPGGRLRLFNGAGVLLAGATGSLLAQVDVGAQEALDGDGWDAWYGATLIGRLRAGDRVHLVGRVEGFRDAGQVVIATPAGRPGFDALGASVGVDVQATERAVWRTELRGMRGADAIFDRFDPAPRAVRTAGVLVTSLALRL